MTWVVKYKVDCEYYTDRYRDDNYDVNWIIKYKPKGTWGWYNKKLRIDTWRVNRRWEDEKSISNWAEKLKVKVAEEEAGMLSRLKALVKEATDELAATDKAKFDRKELKSILKGWKKVEITI